MNRYLTAQGFAHAPPLLGDIVRVAEDGTPHTIAIALGFVRNQGDAWSWMLDHLTRALDSRGPSGDAQHSEADTLSDCEGIAASIGRYLGEMHMVLARETTDRAFAPEVADADDAADWAQKTEQRLEKAFGALDHVNEWAREQDRERAKALLAQHRRIGAAVRNLAKSGAGSAMTRTHGDFHLGQVLVASGEAYLIDFEGEPATSIAERRAKTSPLRDVAGLLRSIDYAGAALIDRKDAGAIPIDETQRDQVVEAFRTRASSAFMSAYWNARGSSRGAAERALLDLFLIEKAAYEIAYEVANRPTWIGVPLAGLSALTTRILDKDPGGRDG
jgi:maltose alpha-D-glucosyltransferase / alpha-amylase